MRTFVADVNAAQDDVSQLKDMLMQYDALDERALQEREPTLHHQIYEVYEENRSESGQATCQRQWGDVWWAKWDLEEMPQGRKLRALASIAKAKVSELYTFNDADTILMVLFVVYVNSTLSIKHTTLPRLS